MDIRESDLPGLPYKPMRWFCMVEGCTCKTTVRDYGIPPIYWWPIRIIREKNGDWRGGWTSALHGYICSRHFKEYKANPRAFMKTHIRDADQLLSKIIPITKKLKHGTTKSNDAGFWR